MIKTARIVQSCVGIRNTDDSRENKYIRLVTRVITETNKIVISVITP